MGSLLGRGGAAEDRRPPADRRLCVLLGSIGLALVAAVGWWPSLSLWFPAADTLALIETARFDSVAGFRDLWTSRLMEGTTFPADYYRPVSALSYALDFRLWGRNAAGYQVTNFVLHVMVALLVAYLVLTAGRADRDLPQARRDWRPWAGAGAAAFLLLFHPLAAEVVPAPARRQDLLATFFLTGTIILAGEFFGRPSRADVKLLLAAWMSWLLALGSKEIAVVGGPLLALVVWWAHLHRDWGRRPKMFAVAASGFGGIFLLYLCVRTLILGGLGGEGSLSVDPGSSLDAVAGYVASWVHPVGYLVGGLSDGLALSGGLALMGFGSWLWFRSARSRNGRWSPDARILAAGFVTAGLIMAAGPWMRARLLEAYRADAVQGVGAIQIPARGHLTVFEMKWGLAVTVTAVLGLVGNLSVLGWRRIAVAGVWKAAGLVSLVAPAGVFALAQNFSSWSGYLALVPLAALFGCMVTVSLSVAEDPSAEGEGGEPTFDSRSVLATGGIVVLALLSLSPTFHGLDATRTTSRIAERGLEEIGKAAEAAPVRAITVAGFPDTHPAFLGRPTVSQLTRPPADYTVRAYLALFGRRGALEPAVELLDPIAVEDPSNLPSSSITAWMPDPSTVVLCWPGVNEHLSDDHRCPTPAEGDP